MDIKKIMEHVKQIDENAVLIEKNGKKYIDVSKCKHSNFIPLFIYLEGIEGYIEMIDEKFTANYSRIIGDKQQGENDMNKDAIIKGYITNLGKYNEGDLVYKLISFPISDEELNEALKEIGCMYTDENGVVHNPLYEEYFFSDWECEIPFEYSEYESVEDLNIIAERVEALEAYEQDVLKVIMEGHTSDVDEALRIVEDSNYTIWNDCINMADVAEQMVDEYGYLNDVPENLRCYIDYEAWGRDLAIEGTFLEGDGFFIEVLN